MEFAYQLPKETDIYFGLSLRVSFKYILSLSKCDTDNVESILK
jgi:hypothetical protein